MKAPPTKKSFDPVNNYINWFEIPASNIERAVKFYNYIFKFKMETNTMNGYSMAFFPTKSGTGGAIICGEGIEPSEKGPLLYLNGGNDIDGILLRIEEAGGRIIMQKQEINQEAGFFALFLDSEGNKLAIHARE